MIRLLLLALIFLVSACSIQTEGLPDNPETWRAWSWCGDAPTTTIPPRETTTVGGWSCMPLDPRGDQAAVHCWRGETEFDLIAYCQSTKAAASAVLGECTIQLACSRTP